MGGNPQWGIDRNRDYAFEQRDDLLVYLTGLYDAHLCRHPEDPKWPGWMWVVSIHMPMSDLMWHVPEQELYKFQHLPIRANDWVGMTIEERSLLLREPNCELKPSQ